MGLKILGKMGIIAIKQDVMRIKLHEDTVICRVGSLENVTFYHVHAIFVICRVGSLEKIRALSQYLRKVICRVGSLETVSEMRDANCRRYLPCRQFRNI